MNDRNTRTGDGEQRFRKSYFIYGVECTLVANGTQDFPVLITDDDFVITNVARTQTGTFSLRFTDTGSDRNRENMAVPDNAWFGNILTLTGTYELPTPITVLAKSTVTLRLTDTSAAPNTVKIFLIGYKKLPVTL